MEVVEERFIERSIRRLRVWCVSCWVVLWIGATIPALVFGVENDEIHIQSKTMVAKNKERRAIFKGDVVFTQGELVVYSDIMFVWWKPSSPSAKKAQEENETQTGNKIEKAVARGKVIIEKSSGRATCKQAIYFKDEEKVVLTGSPIAWQDGTRVSGSKMIMYLNEDRTEVEGQTRVIIQDGEGN